jgi:hypothetical protein
MQRVGQIPPVRGDLQVVVVIRRIVHTVGFSMNLSPKKHQNIRILRLVS